MNSNTIHRNLVDNTPTARETGFAADWRACFDSFAKLAPFTRECIRGNIAAYLARVNPPGHGISSSDRNHALFGRWKRCGGDWDAVVLELVDEAL